MMKVNKIERFLIISIIPQNLSENDAFENIKETISLVETYGGVIEDILLQKREVHDKGMYIGTGKIAEAAEIIKEKQIDVVVLNAIIKPGQIYDIFNLLSKARLDIQVWDRVDLILKIFASHANTAEAKLQIELAAMRHMGPRIYGMGMEMSQQSAGIGTRGIGETNTELMKRHWRIQIKKVRDRLEKVSAARQRLLENRLKLGLNTISIVGYTNAGKTSLFNKLVGKKKLVKNALFATLDSTAGKLHLPGNQKEILLSDTIGFIRDLPPQLIDAFKSTLMESIHADLLLLVIDISDSDITRKIKVVEDILKDIGASHQKKVYVFNKVDQVKQNDIAVTENLYKNYHPQFISVKKEIGISNLIQTIADYLD